MCLQWQHDESVLSGDVKAALENTEAGSQTQEALPNAATNQQQVSLYSCMVLPNLEASSILLVLVQ